jgi:hypothetical protein
MPAEKRACRLKGRASRSFLMLGNQREAPGAKSFPTEIPCVDASFEYCLDSVRCDSLVPNPAHRAQEQFDGGAARRLQFGKRGVTRQAGRDDHPVWNRLREHGSRLFDTAPLESTVKIRIRESLSVQCADPRFGRGRRRAGGSDHRRCLVSRYSGRAGEEGTLPATC